MAVAVLRNTTLNRAPQFTRCLSYESCNYVEIRIPVPWGYLAGKWWGPQDKRPILCSHGWQDNCGTFDTLIPKLPSHLGYLAIDFPGHGHSSQLPPGIFYHGIDGAILLKRIIDYFSWSKVSLLGHSLGGIMNYQYAVLFPDTVDFMICLENFKPLVTHENEKKIERMVKAVNHFLEYDRLNSSNKEPPSYSYDTLEKLLHEGFRKSISLECCKYLLERNIAASRKEPNKYYFARDPRLKESLTLTWSQEDAVCSTRRVTCPIFLSKASASPFFEPKKNVIEAMEALKKVNRNFEYHAVEGTHHVHLNHPERLSGLINAFIEKYDVEDRSEGGLISEIKISHIRSS